MAGGKSAIPYKVYKNEYFKLDESLFIKFRQAHKEDNYIKFFQKKNT